MWETGSQSGQVTLELQSRVSHEGLIRGEMDLLEPHDCGGPVSSNIAVDGKDLAGPFLLDALANLKE